MNLASRDIVVQSLAGKHGAEVDDIRDELRSKAHAKVKREYADKALRDRVAGQIDDLFRPSE